MEFLELLVEMIVEVVAAILLEGGYKPTPYED